MKSPFFVLSSGRSGSTLLSSMLDMHPDIHVPVELWGLYSTLPRTLRSYGDLSRTRNARILAADLQRIGQLNEFGVVFDIEYFVETLSKRDKDLRSVVECFYETLLRETGKPRIGDKTPNNLPFVGQIGNVFPEAKIIHLVRDGRDCALSSIKSRTGLNYRNLYELGSDWPKDNEQAADYGKKHPDYYFRIRYEDLIGDAENALEQLCAFLDEAFAPEMLEFSRGQFAKENSSVLSHHRNLAKDIISDNVAKWRTGLTPNQVEVYDSLAGGVLEEFGYVVDRDRQGFRWRLLRLGYRLATAIRKALRSVKTARKAVWRSVCVAAKKVIGTTKLRDMSSPLQ